MGYADNFKVFGPYKRQDGRQLVIVVDNNSVRRTISYPKWLLEMQLGRPLDPDLETVQHLDGDHSNNDDDNLKLMPREEHSAQDTRRVKNLKFNCAWCSSEFERSPRLIRDKAKKNKAGPFCSRSCAGRYSRMLQLKIIDKLNPQQHVESEYYNRRDVTASAYSELEIDFDFLDLLLY